MNELKIRNELRKKVKEYDKLTLSLLIDSLYLDIMKLPEHLGFMKIKILQNYMNKQDNYLMSTILVIKVMIIFWRKKMNNTSMNTVFIDEYSNQKKEIQVLRSVTQRLAKEKQELEIQIEVQQRTIADLRDKLESK